VAKCNFTEKAEHDLQDIIDYTLQQWGASQAYQYIDGLENQGQLLANNPNLGIQRDAIYKGLLSFPYESHILFYVKNSSGITIIRVLHQSMGPLKHL